MSSGPVCRAFTMAVSLAIMTQSCASVPAVRTGEGVPASRESASYGNLPLSFVANTGHSDERVKFVARGQGYSLFLTPTEAVLALRASTADGDSSSVVRMRLVGGNTQPQVTGLDPLPGRSNYFIGNDPARWQRDVANFAKVKYTGVYPGVDQIYYGNQRRLEYDFVVAPEADPGRITLAFEGVQALSVDADGNLVLQTRHGDVTQRKPVIYQEIDGNRHPVEGSYVLRANDQVGFDVGSYDTTQALVIDPVLSYSTYLGGNGNDIGNAIAVDGAGDAYITGETFSTNFPGASGSAIQSAKSASYDVFVTKLNSEGTAVVYSTYLGGSGGDFGEAIAVDSTGSAYVTGQTDSQIIAGTSYVPFPTTAGVVQPTYSLGPGDAFVTKINPAGNALVYSTYLGGNGVERGYGIAVDSAGNAYVTGHTNATNTVGGLRNFPTVGAFQPQNAGNYDAFVSKLNATGTAFLYSTFLGGTASEYSIYGGDIAVDDAGNAYVAGSTSSANFPRPSGSAVQATNGGGFVDGFVVKFNPAGSALVYSTYLGGSGYDEINGLAIDSGGDAYVVGYTSSSNFPVVSPLQPLKSGSASGNDAFAARINAAGTAFVYSTFLGGSAGDIAFDVAVDSRSIAYVAGWTQSASFPVLNALQAVNRGSGDAFISALNAAGSAFVFSTYWGGQTGWEYAYGIAVDSVGNVFVTGETNSDDFPTASAVQPTYASRTAGPDAFVIKIAPAPLALEPPTNLMATSVTGNTVTLAWTAPVNSITPTGYVLEGGFSPGQVLASISTGGTGTSFTFVAPTGSFYLRMHSTSGTAKSAASNEIRVFVNTPAPPSAPANLLGAVVNRDLTLAWINTAGGGAPTGIILDVTGAVTLSMSLPVSEVFSFASVPNGTYTFSLRASNGAGVSGSSNSVTLTFPAVCSGAPGTPTAFQATNTGALITASWGLPASGPAPSSYTLAVSGAFNGSFAVQGRSISGLVGSGSYTLSVVATNACGTSAASTPQTVTIP
jgi:hypothetical protein